MRCPHQRHECCCGAVSQCAGRWAVETSVSVRVYSLGQCRVGCGSGEEICDRCRECHFLPEWCGRSRCIGACGSSRSRWKWCRWAAASARDQPLRAGVGAGAVRFGPTSTRYTAAVRCMAVRFACVTVWFVTVRACCRIGIRCALGTCCALVVFVAVRIRAIRGISCVGIGFLVVVFFLVGLRCVPHVRQKSPPARIGGEETYQFGVQDGAIGEGSRVLVQPQQRVEVDVNVDQRCAARGDELRRCGHRAELGPALAHQRFFAMTQREQGISAQLLLRPGIVRADRPGEFVENRIALGTFEHRHLRHQRRDPVVASAYICAAFLGHRPVLRRRRFLRVMADPQSPDVLPERFGVAPQRCREDIGFERRHCAVAGTNQRQRDGAHP